MHNNPPSTIINIPCINKPLIYKAKATFNLPVSQWFPKWAVLPPWANEKLYGGSEAEMGGWGVIGTQLIITLVLSY